jgi:hypothetical protein
LEQIWILRMQEMTFPGLKFQKFSGAWYIGHTRGFQPLLSPSNILSHWKVPFQKMPPHGKILKKGPGLHGEISARLTGLNLSPGWKIQITWAVWARIEFRQSYIYSEPGPLLRIFCLTNRRALRIFCKNTSGDTLHSGDGSN